MANTTNQQRVQSWRGKNAQLNKERNKMYSKRLYYWKKISAEFRNIDITIFQ
jgi:hypothetical protein